MGLSPSTVFHFTSKAGLFGILENNFKLKYCLEEIFHNNKDVEIAVPLVSFCDIKISDISEHISKYGEYGIGLSKEWAIKNGLNPVIYMNTTSDFYNELITVIRKIINGNFISNQEKYKLSNLIRYTKIYEGDLFRKGQIEKNYRFADEREWRYAPEIKQNNKFEHWLLKNRYDTQAKKDVENQKLSNERLKFNPNDIMYLIVNTEEEIIEIIQHIRNFKGKNYSLNDVDRLTSRILSCERILNDF